ncbi:GTP-binding protein [Clostridium sp. AM58-1XD]|uniref:TIGR03943 family putative permease subunit n=1 Tax=Clostridium sp. AM58-1XD TaxID=2292307 RepID=UPI000E49B2EE|nr:GTP-binding protein [Clostridium sp. AM58-1XD]RGY96350.1 GTPase [Clostridium sp. AM58-1XD]
MGPMIEDEIMPVFLINGFLEAGKTEFLKFTMDQEYFQIEGKTLLIVCEEGDTDYEKELLERTKTAVVYIEDFSDLTAEKLTELELLYNPERVVIEWNGMWNQDELKLPEDWTVYQQITIADGSTFELYLKNMKPLLGAMLRNTELVIMNRCDGISEEVLGGYRRTIKAMGRQADIVFETSEGEVEPEITEEDLPYDMKADVISISPDQYGIWYIDCMDRPKRYAGRVVEFTAMVMKSPEFPKNYFVPGRMAMTCCEADMTFLGYICKAREARLLENGNWVRVRAKVALEYWKDYNGEGPVLYAESVEPAAEIKEIVQF